MSLHDHFLAAFGRPPEATAAAPGRLEFIGNHTDYNGGLVMGVAIDRRVTVAAARRSDRAIGLASTSVTGTVTASLDAITPRAGAEAWANYVLGVLDSLIQNGLNAPVGFDLAVTTDLPPGAGLSSSAAFELATAHALAALYGFRADAVTYARLCRKAENHFVGMPCGLLDQGVCAYARADHLVQIDCHTEAFSRVPLPPGLRFHVINTPHKHSLVDSLYATRNRECQEAFAALRQRFPDLPCLAHATPQQVEDTAAQMSPEAANRARHVTAENARVKAVATSLENGDITAVGRLLTASHNSSRELFDNSVEQLDFLVEALQDAPGVYGCRLTGGGFGGAVMALTDETFSASRFEAINAAFADRFGQPATHLNVATGNGANVIDGPSALL